MSRFPTGPPRDLGIVFGQLQSGVEVIEQLMIEGVAALGSI